MMCRNNDGDDCDDAVYAEARQQSQSVTRVAEKLVLPVSVVPHCVLAISPFTWRLCSLAKYNSLQYTCACCAVQNS